MENCSPPPSLLRVAEAQGKRRGVRSALLYASVQRLSLSEASKGLVICPPVTVGSHRLSHRMLFLFRFSLFSKLL